MTRTCWEGLRHDGRYSTVSLSHVTDLLRAGGPAALERIVKQYGPLSARLAALHIAIEKRVAQPRTKNYPPAVFLAYKWENEAHQARVRDIAEYLRGRGIACSWIRTISSGTLPATPKSRSTSPTWLAAMSS